MSSPSSEPRTYTARWVFPAAGPPLQHGIVTVRGEKIEAVEPHGTRTPDEDFGNAAIIPGLVNAHTHLDLTGARGLIPPTDPDHFTDWLRGVIAYRRTRTPEQVLADIRAGLAECLRSGTTLLGDIAAEGASWDTVSTSPTRAIIFWELIGTTKQRFGGSYHDYFLATQIRPSTPNCVWGKSPHAPYSVLRAGFSLAVSLPGVYAVHLAESPAEHDLLTRRQGPLVTFLQDLGVWRTDGLYSGFHELLDSLDPELLLLLVHANYLPRDVPISRSQSVVYCPRTHAAFRHPPHPFREFLRRGVRVCLGTDSLASNPDLDILAEARFVHAKYPDFPGDTLLKMVTLSGAEALGWADETGSLGPGKSADFVVVPLPERDAADPHALLFADHPGDRRTLFRGQWRP